MSDISELNFLPVESSPMMPESTLKELRHRLSLYQVFVKLYEHHSSFLEQILELENMSECSLKIGQSYYVQADINGDAVRLTTNLRNGTSQSLLQSQNTWTVGRDRSNGIYLNNQYISRRHAAIRYIEDEFYLIDFNSTNGTYVNGEQIYQPTKLEDGDIVRIGNINFSFFLNQDCYVLPTVAIELLMQLLPSQEDGKTEISNNYKNRTKTRKLDEDELLNEENLSNDIQMQTFEEQLSQQWKSRVLDRFYRKQADDN